MENLIIGEWKSYKDEIYGQEESPTKLLNARKSEHQEIHIKLMEKGKGFDYSMEVNFKYKLQNKNLFLGNREYTIENLTEKELVIVTIPKSTSIVRHRYYFRKVNENQDN